MSTTQPVRTRIERAASLKIDSNSWIIWFRKLREGRVLLRLSVGLLAAVIITVGLRGWIPPFPFRINDVHSRAIIARVGFQMPDAMSTEVAKNQAARDVYCIYENRSQLITQLRGALKDQLFGLLGIEGVDQLSASQLDTLNQLLDADETTTNEGRDAALKALNVVFGDEKQRDKIDKVLITALASAEENGLLRSLAHGAEQGNQRWIRVFATGTNERNMVSIDVARVRIAEAISTIRTKIDSEFKREFDSEESKIVANLVFHYLNANLPETLSFRQDLSDLARKEAINKVEPVMVNYQSGIANLVRAGKPLTNDDTKLLRAEHDAWIANEFTWFDRVVRLLAFLGMIAAFYLACGYFIYHQFDATVITQISRLWRFMSLVVVCILASVFASQDPMQAEIIPIVMCSITASIVYGRPMALMLMSTSALAITIGLGLSLGELVVLLSAGATSIMLLDRIRSPQRLTQVGVVTAAVCSLTTIGVGIMLGHAHGPAELLASTAASGTTPLDALGMLQLLCMKAAWLGAFCIVASLTMTGLLSYIEKAFDVQTDLSLLQLGDQTHALLRQLAQRAPGTYNHSINVAAIAEAAADSIGAHGLLTRVGAYFHDIGKMFKPTYFIENQGQGANRHDTLLPAMSTLVIIAHVKDGADLARQHKLPRRLVDFIEQHHGTTLVEYFFRQATKQNENNPNGEEVSELNFRYPGPKPQSLEAAVLMLADAVESASRSLVEPTPSRIQNLVDQIAMKRLLDGQFDESGLTLQQLDKAKQSLVKSLTAIYHGRVKYPDQQRA